MALSDARVQADLDAVEGEAPKAEDSKEGVEAKKEEVKKEEAKKQEQSIWAGAAENGTALLAGLVFGFCLDKAKTNVPLVVSSQMAMSNFTMMRMFLAASSTSVGVVLLLDAVGAKPRKPKAGVALGAGLLKGFGGNLLGGMLLGMGMFLTGSCPGTVWAQVGAAMPNVGYIVLGGLAGTLAFGYAEPMLSKRLSRFRETTSCNELSARKHYFPAATAVLAVFAGAIAFFNVYFPWEGQTQAVMAKPIDFDALRVLSPTDPVWDPLVAGVLLGLLQLPVQLTSASALGQSSAWVLVASYLANVVDFGLDRHSPYLKSAQSNRAAAFQLLVAAGIAAGAAASQALSGYPALTLTAAEPLHSPGLTFLGGFLMLIGARLGSGCTSGHGLSGMATLSIASTVSVVGMFAGGMLLGLVPRLVA